VWRTLCGKCAIERIQFIKGAGVRANAQGVCGQFSPGAGFSQKNISLNALDARQMDFEFYATEPGAIVMDFTLNVNDEIEH